MQLLWVPCSWKSKLRTTNEHTWGQGSDRVREGWSSMLQLAYSLRRRVEGAQVPLHFPGFRVPSGDWGDWKKMEGAEEDEEDKEGWNGAGRAGRRGRGHRNLSRRFASRRGTLDSHPTDNGDRMVQDGLLLDPKNKAEGTAASGACGIGREEQVM